MNALPHLAEVAATDVYTALSLDGKQLLLPQNDVAMLELAVDVQLFDTEQDQDHPDTSTVDAASYDDSVIGTLAFQGGQWPVYCFDSELRLTSVTAHKAGSRGLCALLHCADGLSFQGVLCDAVNHVEAVSLSIQGLPECMHSPSSPTAALALQVATEESPEAVMTVTTSAHLAQLINGETTHG